ncbi:MAG: nitroreductase family protein [Acidobacteriota bacterium]|nr:MAG: nitroreductase family protein [Acidobacteriota bacterium]
MDVKKAIEERGSVRKYEKREVPDRLLRKLIDAARLAPSGRNAQPSKYFIVKDGETKAKLRKNKVFAQAFVYKAPAIIVCCAEPGAYTEHDEEWDAPRKIRAIRDLSIASSFLVLRATELGLGTCYIGWVKKEKIKEVLGIPTENFVLFVITVGYPAEQPEPTSRKSIEEIQLQPHKY